MTVGCLAGYAVGKPVSFGLLAEKTINREA